MKRPAPTSGESDTSARAPVAAFNAPAALSVRLRGSLALTSPSVFERLRTHGDIFRRVCHAGMSHELLQPPSVHAAIGLNRPGRVPQTMRVNGEVDLRVATGRGDHLVYGEACEGVTAFAGEHVSTLGFLFPLKTLQSSKFIALQVMRAVNAAL